MAKKGETLRFNTETWTFPCSALNLCHSLRKVNETDDDDDTLYLVFGFIWVHRTPVLHNGCCKCTELGWPYGSQRSEGCPMVG